MTGSLGNKLPGDKTWEANLYANYHRCDSTPRYVKVLFRSQSLRSQFMTGKYYL